MADLNSFFGDSKEITPQIVKDKAGDLRSNIDDIIKKGRPWPQITSNPGFSNASGFLPPLLVSPMKNFKHSDSVSSDGNNPSDLIDSDSEKLATKQKYGEYEYEDWIGQKITPNGLVPIDTQDRFNESRNLPKSGIDLETSPYSMRDSYLIFNDNATDYFKHGLQVLNNLTPIENPENGNSTLRLGQFTSTPSENSDPVMFGFEIVIDDLSSPLLNGAVKDFLNNYSGIHEIGSKIPVYEDFKQQFIKFFKTRSTVKIDINQDSISNSDAIYAASDSSKSLRQNGKKAYMNYYLKKVGGLSNLSEVNTSDTKKYLADYRKDVITLEFNEDVSLSLGSLSHLYKLLYWSKPNGKTLVPENLLRFNCDIIISECRNFNKVKKGIENGNIEVVKDNLSRYVYSLRECQLFFNKMPHSDEIDMSNISIFESHNITFDYKYSTTKFEKFMPGAGGTGRYVGYDGGAIWKIGNPGARGTQSSNIDTSLPRFFTTGGNKFGQNGVTEEFLLNTFGIKLPQTPEGFTTEEKVNDQERKKETALDLQSLKKATLSDKSIKDELNKLKSENKSKLDSITKAKNLSELTQKPAPVLGNYIERLKDKTVKSAKRELATLVNGRVNLLSRTLNKLAIGFVGRKGISPPQNVYTNKGGPLQTAFGNLKDRFFYDIRNELTDFAGDSLSNFLNSASYKK